MTDIKNVANLIEVLKDTNVECDIVVRVPELTDADFRITKIVKEYNLVRNSLARDKIVLICV